MRLAERLSQYATSPTIILLTIAVGFLFVQFYLFRRDDIPASWGVPATIPSSRNWPILGDLRFFSGRWDQYEVERASSKSGCFSFHVGSAHVTALTGRDARTAYFVDPKLSLSQGFSFLFGVQGTNVVEAQDEADNYFARRLSTLISPKVLNARLPKLVGDVNRRLIILKERSPNGIFSPFDEMLDLIFLLTMRTVGCDDIAEDDAWCTRTRMRFERLEENFVPSTVIAPWLPTPAKLKRFVYGTKLYLDFQRIVKERQKTGKRAADPFQILVDEGDDVETIVKFVLNALFAGQVNSSVNASYLVYCFSLDTHSRERALREIKAAASAHCVAEKRDAPLVEQLSSLTLEAWETKLPFFDACIKESIRHMLQGSSYRRNVAGKPVTLADGVVIPPGGYVVWRFGESHLDPEIFPDPDVWDPTRFDESNEKAAYNRGEPHSYIGWGTGRHPCGGMRFAKLELKILLAITLAHFPNLTGCDRNGTPILPANHSGPIRTVISTENPGRPVTSERPLPTLPLNVAGSKRPAAETWVKI